jgi:hypothetical protein
MKKTIVSLILSASLVIPSVSIAGNSMTTNSNQSGGYTEKRHEWRWEPGRNSSDKGEWRMNTDTVYHYEKEDRSRDVDRQGREGRGRK